jgi:hypothetical protein
VITTWQATVVKLSPESRAVLRLVRRHSDPVRALVMGGATEVVALTGLARYSIILDATDTTFGVHGLVQTVSPFIGGALPDVWCDHPLFLAGILLEALPKAKMRKADRPFQCRSYLPYLRG